MFFNIYRKLINKLHFIFCLLKIIVSEDAIKEIVSERILKNKAYNSIVFVQRKLFNLGFYERATSDLYSIANNSKNIYEKGLAAKSLVLWHSRIANSERAQLCLELIPLIVVEDNDLDLRRQIAIMESECLSVLGNTEEARSVLWERLGDVKHTDLFLAMANLESDTEKKISLINKALDLNEMNNLDLRSSNNKDTFDCLVGKSVKNSVDEKGLKTKEGRLPLVTVIMPAYNAAAHVSTAIESILSQTWHNIELLLVNDCSIDDTFKIACGYEKNDSRIKVFSNKENRGTYFSRNVALSHAQGEFVCCHDVDDWSNPAMLELQVRHLIENPNVVANSGQMARATSALKFCRRDQFGAFINNSMVSSMFRREAIMDVLGYWDCVRFNADSEMMRRIRKVFGQESVVELETGLSSFLRQHNESLTADQNFGTKRFLMGARKEYYEAQIYHHRKASSLYYDFPPHPRPFVVPEIMLPVRDVKRSNKRYVDVVHVADFRVLGSTLRSVVEEIDAEKKAGFRIGLVQMADYNYNPKAEVVPLIRELVDGEQVQFLVYGESVSSGLLTIHEPLVLQEWQMYVADIKPENVKVVINRPPAVFCDPEIPVLKGNYNLSKCRQNLLKYFKAHGSWHPGSSLVRKALSDLDSELYEDILLNDDWHSVIDLDRWNVEAKPKVINKIRIGRHSKDVKEKWPDTLEDVINIYPDSENYEVNVLGGATTPEKLLRKLPDNWKVYKFGKMDSRVFLSNLDIYVYYPSNRLTSSSGRAIMEAMAAGIPVICHPRFREMFGDSVIYANPPEVKAHIDKLMMDEDYYQGQVLRAKNFLKNHYILSRHIARLEQTL